MTLKKKLLFSTVSVAGFFLLLEGLLALFGVAKIHDTSDPYVGFSSRVPLLQLTADATGQPILKTAPAKLVWFNQQTFAPRKPPGTQRVFCVGGSTTFGRPYSDVTSYCGWLRELLPAVDRTQRWEVINAGGVSYASYRVAAVMEELSAYEPDLFIVYTAHNEFLERRTYAKMFEPPSLTTRITSTLSATRTWSALHRLVNRADRKPADEVLPAEVDEILNHSIGPADYQRDHEWHSKVLQHYEINLRRMVSIARNAGAEIVFVTPASNEKNCAPFKSVFSDDVNQDARDRFEQYFNEGVRLADSGQHGDAIVSFQKARQIDDRHARLQYRLGQSLLATSRYDEAFTAFRTALNEDVCPLRAVDAITESIRDVANDQGVGVIDFEQKLREKSLTDSGNKIFGDEYFLDHVHPTIEIHKRFALWMIDDLIAQAVIRGKPPQAADIQSATQRIEARIDRKANGIALRNLAKVLHWAGKFDEAAPRAIDALELIRDDPESLFVLADCLTNTGQAEQAIERYETLLRIHPFYDRAFLPFGEALVSAERFDDAKLYLEFAIAVQQENSAPWYRAKYFLGIAELGLGNYEQAMVLLQQVLDQHAGEPRTLFYLAQSKAGVGKTEEAIELYRKSLQIDPAATTYHYLGLAYMKSRQYDEAVACFEAALRIDPDHPQVQQNLGIARQLQNASQPQQERP